jgi:hypothetical protein
MMPNGFGGDSAFANPVRPTGIDLPQRFGEGAYGRLDPGESGVRLDLPFVAAGRLDARAVLGPGGDAPDPAREQRGRVPARLSRLLRAGERRGGRVHGRLVWGELSHSPTRIMREPGARRMMSGIVGVFVPRWIPGLEIGGGRFFHSPWPEDAWSLDTFLKPLEGILKESLDTGLPTTTIPTTRSPPPSSAGPCPPPGSRCTASSVARTTAGTAATCCWSPITSARTCWGSAGSGNEVGTRWWRCGASW